tara:strand:- start:125 stop:466 length:342 start_codon:yes stop_codon:yes gene_type:complete
MEPMSAMLLFFSGVLAHAAGIRIFKTWSKSAFYKMTFINCLAILKFAESTSRDLVDAAVLEDDKSIDKVFESWRIISMLSLQSVIPDHVWRQIAVRDWDQAMRLLSSLEQKGE